jgi:hypothetical protein
MNPAKNKFSGTSSVQTNKCTPQSSPTKPARIQLTIMVDEKQQYILRKLNILAAAL